ncbi:uncharacterized protein EDB93DRAFT_1268741 [Suillus bovinus]|uniref:uncharacterized protein n=1 Tax=Suillus bovinus TaxID=48563 RepID=UPI001B876FDE|nr:uncharacterized protein EDB93DRAFT_1268741 [Suillus bovinus]KAG2128050.1 hypothetical protein EDB93DRAFT_1268741 [Suillus bovinus]
MIADIPWVATMALITLWTYDYICSLHDEWTFLLRSRWTKTYVVLTFFPNETPKECKIIINIYSCFAVISLTCSECIVPSSRHKRAPDPIHPGFFVLRTYALWGNNRTVLVAMLSTLFVTIASFIGIWFTTIPTSQYFTSSNISGIPGIVGGYRTSSSAKLYLPFILLLVFQLALVSLTLIRAIQDWRSTRYPLHAALVKHNISYYACGLFFSTLNVFVPLAFPDSSYHSFLEDLEVFILAILATRMHLYLWQVNNTVHSFGALVSIPMSDVSA